MSTEIISAVCAVVTVSIAGYSVYITVKERRENTSFHRDNSRIASLSLLTSFCHKLDKLIAFTHRKNIDDINSFVNQTLEALSSTSYNYMKGDFLIERCHVVNRCLTLWQEEEKYSSSSFKSNLKREYNKLKDFREELLSGRV